MKKILITILIYCYTYACISGTDLNPGDLAITAFNFKDPDQFSFVTFVAIEAGTVIYFTDCGWKDNNAFREGEGLITYTVPVRGLNAKDVISYPSDPGFVTEGVSGFFGFAVAGDQILSFQGSFAAPEFIYALSNEFDWQTSATDNQTSALPPGLTLGQTAVALSGGPNAYYNCSVESAPLNVLLTEISDASNWVNSSTSVNIPSSCFQNPLSVVFESFEFVKDAMNYKACVRMECSNETIIYLEKSISESSFQVEDSIIASNSGDNTFCFEISNEAAYYKVTAKEKEQRSFYSTKVKFLKEDNLLHYICVYNLQGVCLYHSKAEAKETNWQSIAKSVKHNGGLIFQTMNSNGVIETKKILIQEE